MRMHSYLYMVNDNEDRCNSQAYLENFENVIKLRMCVQSMRKLIVDNARCYAAPISPCKN